MKRIYKKINTRKTQEEESEDRDDINKLLDRGHIYKYVLYKR